MKTLIFLNIIIATLSTSVHAATISAYANDFLDSSGSFVLSPGSTALGTVVTNDIDTYVMSNDAEASFDLGFGTNTAITGSGTDLLIFTIGNDYYFGLQVFDINNTILSSFIYNVPGDGSATATDADGNDLCLEIEGVCTAAISATAIDLFDSSFNTIADNTEIGFIRLFIGSDYSGTSGDNSIFALAGAVHTTAVPLPLPAVLFSSGLFLLGWIGRKKTA